MAEHVVESKRIPDTKWCICLTSLDHELFWNEAENKSCWDIPEEILDLIGSMLQDNEEEEIEVLIEEPIIGSDQMEEDQRKRILEEDEQEQEVKRFRLEEDLIESVHVEVIEDTPILPALSNEEYRQAFTELLNEMNPSPFSSWDLQLPVLSKDFRSQGLSQKEYKSIFESWCTERSAKVLQDNRNLMKDTRLAFQSLLDEFVVQPRHRFDDLCRRFKRDSRFSNFEQKEREVVFLLHTSALKKVEKLKARKEKFV